MIKLFETWRKVKDIFVKPSVKVYFGKWKNDPNLPVWKGGPMIYPLGRRKTFINSYYPADRVMIKTGEAEYHHQGKTYTTPTYDWADAHTLPKGIKTGRLAWNRNFRKKLRRYGLGWIPPSIQLPYWMMFRIINLDVLWKTKYSDVRYEFPPQLSFIAFGLSLTFTLHCPYQNRYSCDDHYWEAILTHIYDNNSGSLEETIQKCGIWSSLSANGESSKFFSVRPYYIKNEYLDDYYSTISMMCKDRQEKVL